MKITAPSTASADAAECFNGPAAAESCGTEQQVARSHGHDLCRVDHVVDQNVLVRLMREVEDSGAIGYAVPQLADAIAVLLIVGSRRTNKLRLATRHALNRGGGAARHRTVAIRHGGQHFEYVAKLVGEAPAFLDEPLQNFAHLALDAVHVLFDEQAAIDDDSAGVRNTW